MYGKNNNESESLTPDAEIINNENTFEDDLISEGGMYCEKCDITYKEEYEFCPECGERLIVKAEPVSLAQDDDPGLITCPHCGFESPVEFVFCPGCGKPLSEEPSTSRQPSQENAQTTRSSQQETRQTDGYAPAPNKKSKKKWIILGILAAAAIILIVFINLTAPKELIINSGEDIDIYVGDAKKVEVVGDGLDAIDYQSIILYSDNEDVLKVKDNKKIKAKYDSESFNAITVDDEGNEEADICACTTYLNARFEKGIRKWEGRVKVNISIEPKKLKNGNIIKKPNGDLVSSLTVTAADDYDAYIYLKSKNKKSNDMSFTVKRGKEAKVGVPADEYDLYWAGGTTWYGSKFLFGPDTQYNKTDDNWDFTKYTWTFSMGVENGNLENEVVDEDDFPEL